MNLSNGKRSSTEDINQQRKRRRTLSNDLLRGKDILSLPLIWKPF